MKPLDLADTYDSDDEVTVKTQVPQFIPQIVVPKEPWPVLGLALCLASAGVCCSFIYLIWRVVQ